MKDRKRKGSRRSIAAIGGSVILVAGSLAGCGKAGQDQAGGLSMEPVKGCHVETEVSLPDMWEDASFEEVTGNWLREVSFPWDAYIPLKLLQDQAGDQYLYACYPSEGEELYQGHLWRSQGDGAVEITPGQWTASLEEIGY